nr:sulfatase-like hydrolase/transferase [Comamonas testosteroni]
MKKRPNFLLIVTDQHRADHLGCYGNSQVKTPTIDSLAKSGLRFDRFYVASPVCMANRSTLMTGRMPSLHGVRHNGIALSKDATTFVQLLQAAGYRTALVGKSHLQNMGYDGPGRKRYRPHTDLDLPPASHQDASLSHRNGDDYDGEWTPYWDADPQHDVTLPFYGFDTVRLCTFHGDQVGASYSRWLEARHPNSDTLRGKDNAFADARYSAPQAWRTRVPEELYPTTYIAEQTLNVLDDLKRSHDSGQPFFLKCSFPDPHHPYTPPGKYWDMYDPAEMHLPSSFWKRATSPLVEAVHSDTIAKKNSREGYIPFGVTEREAKEIIALTYGMISMIDDAIARILCHLRESGLDDDTVVIFTSDHGDWMGDHGVMLKGPLHYQGLIRVPFIWRDPASELSSGQVDSGLAGTLDIAKTVLTRAGISPFNGMQGEDLLADSCNSREDRAMVIESEQVMYKFGQDSSFKVRSLVDKRFRLSISDVESICELYDLASDPDECNNLWHLPEHQRLKMHLLEKLCRQQIRLGDESPLPTALA